MPWTSPASRRTRRCLDVVGCVASSAAESSPTARGASSNKSRIRRRVGSARIASNSDDSDATTCNMPGSVYACQMCIPTRSGASTRCGPSVWSNSTRGLRHTDACGRPASTPWSPSSTSNPEPQRSTHDPPRLRSTATATPCASSARSGTVASASGTRSPTRRSSRHGFPLRSPMSRAWERPCSSTPAASRAWMYTPAR